MKSELKCLCFVSIACILLGISPTSSIAANPEFTLRYAGDYPIGSHITRSMEFFEKLVDQKSNGRVKIEVYPASTLFAARDYPRALPSGAVDMCEVVVGQWAGQVPAVMMFNAPYFYKDAAHFHRVYDSEAGEMIAKEFEKANVKVLYWMWDGHNGIASKVPIKKLEDFKGLRIRGFSDICSVWIKAMGGAPVFMGGGEVYMALQRGTIDAGMSVMSSFYMRKYYEVCKYISGIGAIYEADACLINLDKWKSLPSDVQKIMQDASAETVVWSRNEVAKLQAEIIQGLKDKGMDIYYLPEEEEKRWVQASKPALDYVLERIGPIGPKLVEAINKVR